MSFEKLATDKALILELGWISMLRDAVPKDASEAQISEMRKAFFTGGEHLFERQPSAWPGLRRSDEPSNRYIYQKEDST